MSLGIQQDIYILFVINKHICVNAIIYYYYYYHYYYYYIINTLIIGFVGKFPFCRRFFFKTGCSGLHSNRPSGWMQSSLEKTMKGTWWCGKNPVRCWLVVSTYPSEKWWSSMMTFPIYGQIKFMFEITNQIYYFDVFTSILVHWWTSKY